MTTLSSEEARQALADIDAVSRRMRQSMRGDGLTSSILMLWGVLWAVIFGGGALDLPHIDRIAWLLNGVGFLVTAMLVLRRREQVRSQVGWQLTKQLVLFWAVQIAFAVLLPLLLHIPTWPTRLALMLSIVMLGYVVQGLWLKDAVFVVLGLFITATVLVCHAWLRPPQFMLGLGLLGGGALFAAGIAVRLRWR